ncbi:hypothetical protein SDC9_105358 [bioreactor metagenome]|uniref:Uncharacterized protein n=1 Tax=bioreactor metagenome TaxID=1076179 RepID=A0A645AZD8_9ZZZZ
MNVPPIPNVISPNNIPCGPPFATLVKLIPAPNVKPTKGIKISPAGAKKSLKLLSKFPRIIPTIIGITVAIKAFPGILASPDAPNAINVKNGPSFKASKAIAAQSVVSP